MKLENWQLSYNKWNPETGVLSELNKDGRIDWNRVEDLLYKYCGHCKEQSSCIGCTLRGPNKRCGGGMKEDDHYFILEEMAYGLAPRNKRKALAIANRIYNQILKDDPRNMIGNSGIF